MTVHPEHPRSLPSMAPRHTVHPEHKKAQKHPVFYHMIFLSLLLAFYKSRPHQIFLALV